MRAAPSPIVLVCIGVLCGCTVDALMKYVTLETHVLTASAWRYLLAALVMVLLYAGARRPLPGFSAIRFHFLRSLAQVISAVCFFYAITQLALAEAIVLGFTAALMIAPMARLILGEKMTAETLGATLVGFAGAAIAVTGETANAPADGNRLYGMAAVLLSALGYALNIVLLRLRASSEDSLTLVMFMNVFPALFLVPWLIYAGPMPAPDAWPYLCLIATFGIGIWWLMTLAYARAPAQRLAIFEYTGLIWSSLLGYFFFKEVPGLRLYAGAAIIILACLYVAWHTHRERQREPGPSADILQ